MFGAGLFLLQSSSWMNLSVALAVTELFAPSNVYISHAVIVISVLLSFLLPTFFEDFEDLKISTSGFYMFSIFYLIPTVIINLTHIMVLPHSWARYAANQLYSMKLVNTDEWCMWSAFLGDDLKDAFFVSHRNVTRLQPSVVETSTACIAETMRTRRSQILGPENRFRPKVFCKMKTVMFIVWSIAHTIFVNVLIPPEILIQLVEGRKRDLWEQRIFKNHRMGLLTGLISLIVCSKVADDKQLDFLRYTNRYIAGLVFCLLIFMTCDSETAEVWAFLVSSLSMLYTPLMSLVFFVQNYNYAYYPLAIVILIVPLCAIRLIALSGVMSAVFVDHLAHVLDPDADNYHQSTVIAACGLIIHLFTTTPLVIEFFYEKYKMKMLSANVTSKGDRNIYDDNDASFKIQKQVSFCESLQLVETSYSDSDLPYRTT
eukprot:GHVH01011225.1.p1 GENE.GHVH01011225.1~~GHVH01011225.1.p1  ORF type:complete len:429 (+),score=50.74 GHVH01011225.1:2057-3343(+)